MIKIAITGGIGSGKSTISNLFNEIGIPVFNTDICSREAEYDVAIKEGFKHILGDDIYVDGKLDRVKMREIVFVNKEKLKLVNNLVIPYVKEQFALWCEEHKKTSPIIMLESAILFETGGGNNFDYVITVTANEDTRISRAMKRDNSSLEDVRNKLNNQWSEETKILKSNFVIVNEGLDLIDSLPVLKLQIETIKKAILFDVLSKAVAELNELAKNNY